MSPIYILIVAVVSLTSASWAWKMPPIPSPAEYFRHRAEVHAAAEIGAELSVYQNLIKALDVNRTVLKITINKQSTFCANPENRTAQATDGLFTLTTTVDELNCFGDIPHICVDEKCTEVIDSVKDLRDYPVVLTKFKISSNGKLNRTTIEVMGNDYVSYDVVRYDESKNKSYQFAHLLIDGYFWTTVLVNTLPLECKSLPEAEQTGCYWRVYMAKFKEEFEAGRQHRQDLVIG